MDTLDPRIRVVGGGVVHHDDLDIGQCLRQRRSHCAFNVRSHIPGGDKYAGARDIRLGDRNRHGPQTSRSRPPASAPPVPARHKRAATAPSHRPLGGSLRAGSALLAYPSYRGRMKLLAVVKNPGSIAGYRSVAPPDSVSHGRTALGHLAGPDDQAKASRRGSDGLASFLLCSAQISTMWEFI